MTGTYHDLLARRRRIVPDLGVTVSDNDIHESLFDFQKHIVKWALEGGRRAIWADTGLGKTRMMIEWARLTSDKKRLIVAPLAVCLQTVDEAATMGVTVTYIRGAEEVTDPGVYITNYEMLEAVNPAQFEAVALDEASILKNYNGKTRNILVDSFHHAPYRTTWTATPAPNEPEELTNQAEFLGVMTRWNMLSTYFLHDKNGWRLKGHAGEAAIDWISTWAMAVKKPSDLGYPDDGYNLPGLRIHSEVVDLLVTPGEGELFTASIGGVSGRSKVRRETLEARCQRAAELTQDGEQWCLWVGLNAEADRLAELIPDAVNIHGAMSPEDKAAGLHQFARGESRVLITKPSIAAMGLNFQSCSRTAFVGLGDSYEKYYQSIRRFYRFGQTEIVDAHIILSLLEQEIAYNVQAKEKQSDRIIDGLIRRLHKTIKPTQEPVAA